MDHKRARSFPSKSWHPNWKQKLRESCIDRVKTERNQLLWKTRLSEKTPLDCNNRFVPDLECILTDEIDKLNKSVFECCPNANITYDTMLWEYEPSESFSELDPEEYEKLMISMQNILYEEMRDDFQTNKETVLLEDFEKSCEQESYALSVTLEQLQSETDGVICPICKTRKLQQTHHLIFCGCGLLNLNVQHEKVNLEFLRKRLAELWQQHYDLGCKCQPVFCTDNRFSMTALYLQCSLCGAFELVI